MLDRVLQILAHNLFDLFKVDILIEELKVGRHVIAKNRIFQLNSPENSDSLLNSILQLQVVGQLQLLLLADFSLVEQDMYELWVSLLELDVEDVFELIWGTTLLTNLKHSLVDHWEVFKVVVLHIEQVAWLCFDQNTFKWFQNVLGYDLRLVFNLMLQKLYHAWKCGLVDLLFEEHERVELDSLIIVHLLLQNLWQAIIELDIILGQPKSIT